jgi:cell wall-associated protease
MKFYKLISILIVVLFLISCSTTKQIIISDSKINSWQQLDARLDKIPGISFNKWYISKKSDQSANQIIVAVIDTQLDTNHEDLKSQIWINTNEIPNNGIDDDRNRYVDDVNGWSYIGAKNGSYVVWTNFEYVRFVRKWQSIFLDKNESEISKENLYNFKEYKRAKKYLEKENKFYLNWLNSCKYSVSMFPIAKDTLKYFFPKEDYDLKRLDSLYQIYKINNKTFRERRIDNDKDLGALIGFMYFKFEMGEQTYENVIDKNQQIDSIVNKNLNINFNDRATLGDNPEVLEIGYGNKSVNSDFKGIRGIKEHSTKVSSVIAANRNNDLGIKGFSNQIKIMPLHISCSGDENDKDIANAIRYAVDNGAKIINMSFGKEFSVNKVWVLEAIKYAEKKNVLITHCAGNDGFNTDENPFYPNDNDYENILEVSNNFINVGSISKRLDSTFVSSFSNYGKKNVDLFAPGEDIYTAIPGNQYAYDSGTSLAAPMVSGTAALIWLYYPKLSVQEVKQIILDSGTSYNIDVIVPGTKDKKVKFAELSKSGKVLNVYNAMKMAREISKKKK